MRAQLSLAGVLLVLAAPAHAQIGGLKKALDNANKKLEGANAAVGELTFTDEEEQQLGESISKMLRDKYGVVQDKAAHHYVTLVGSSLAQNSARPALKWTFIILDTDGINAFAAPGGFIHITRGALALIHNESELACVLGHEIGHVSAKHTIHAIQKEKLVQAGAKATRSDVIAQAANAGYSMVLENNFNRGDEMDADKIGVTLANATGYAPDGLGAFLTRLEDRYKNATERSGIFASHPETKARLDGLGTVINGKLTAKAAVAPRYTSSISFKLLDVADVPLTAPPTAAPAPSNSKLGLGGLTSLGNQKSGSQATASAGSRGVNTDRDAKGGPVKTPVVVTVTAAEIAAFKQGIV